MSEAASLDGNNALSVKNNAPLIASGNVASSSAETLTSNQDVLLAIAARLGVAA